MIEHAGLRPPGADPDGEPPRRGDPAIRSIRLVALAGLLFSLHVALLAGPLWEADERSHAAYALSLMLGELPTIDTQVVDDPDRFPAISASLAGQDTAHRDIWTANHPPLYYLISLPFVAGADALGVPDAGLLAMRILNAVGFAAALYLVGLIARELVPTRPVIWVLATVVALSCGTVTHLGGFIYNDGLGVAFSSLAILLALRILIRGPSRARLISVMLAATAAAATRVSGILTVVVCCAAVVLTGLHDRHPDRWPRAIGRAAMVAVVPAASIGWFYLRNIGLYGDISASAALLAKFGRQDRGGVSDIAVDLDFYGAQFKGLWVRRFLDGWVAVLPTLIGLAAAVGLAIALIAALWRARRPAVIASSLRAWVRAPRGQGWLLLMGLAVAVEASAISFYSAGGGPHVRYLLQILPLIATVIAIGLMGLLAWMPPARVAARDRVGVGVFGTLLVTVTVVIQLSSRAQIMGRGQPPPLGWLPPVLVLVAATVVAMTAIVTLLRATADPSSDLLSRPLSRPPSRTPPDPGRSRTRP